MAEKVRDAWQSKSRSCPIKPKNHFEHQSLMFPTVGLLEAVYLHYYGTQVWLTAALKLCIDILLLPKDAKILPLK